MRENELCQPEVFQKTQFIAGASPRQAEFLKRSLCGLESRW